MAAGGDLYGVGGLCRDRRRAAHADYRFLFARRVLARAFGRSVASADHRRHWLPLWRLDRRGDLQVLTGLARQSDAAILAILDRPRARRHRSDRPRADDELGSRRARLAG